MSFVVIDHLQTVASVGTNVTVENMTARLTPFRRNISSSAFRSSVTLSPKNDSYLASAEFDTVTYA